MGCLAIFAPLLTYTCTLLLIGYNIKVMSDQTDTINRSIKKLGISDEESLVYLYIAEKGVATALEISKKLSMGRTKVYRILDKLYTLGLTEQKLGSRGFIFELKPLSSLDNLLMQKESELAELKGAMPTLIDKIKALQISTAVRDECKVLYYEGAKGLEQITWNASRVKDKLYIYETGDMNDFLGKSYAEKIRQEHVNRGVRILELTNYKSAPSFTNNFTYVKNTWSVKYIDPENFKIEVDTLIYGDVVAFYHTGKKEPFCVEIHNARLAQMQAELFKFIWNRAKKVRILKPGGAWSL